MKNILDKYPVPQKNNAEEKQFPYPDMSLDLHGHTKEEARKKLEWIINHAKYNNYICIKIITGIGKKILQPLVRKQLRQWKKQEKITDFTEVFHEDSKEKKHAGVFLYTV